MRFSTQFLLIFASAVAAAGLLGRLFFRRRSSPRRIDVGAVSESWLAQVGREQTD